MNDRNQLRMTAQRSGVGMLLRVTLVIFVTEAAIMLSLPAFGISTVTQFLGSAVDAFLLVTVGVPIAYLWGVRPYWHATAAHERRLIAEAQASNRALAAANQELETRVAQRTAELSAEVESRAATEISLRESQERLRLIFNSAADGIAIINDKGIIQSVNRAMERLFGYSVMEMVGRNVNMLIPEPHRSAHDTYIARYLQTHHPRIMGRHVEVEALRKDGTLFPLELSVSVLRMDDGTVTFTGIIHDISARKHAEVELRKLSRAVENSSAIVVITDAQGLIEYANPRLTQISGYSRDEVMGLRPSIFKSGWKRDSDYAEMWREISAGRVWRGEFHNRRKDGTEYWVLASIAPIFDDDGTITHYVAVEDDITARKQVEREIEESRRRFRDFAESTSDWFWETDDQHRFVEFAMTDERLEQEWRKYLGMTRAEVMAGNCPVEVIAAHQAQLDRHQPFRNLQYQLAPADGTVTRISVNGKPMFDECGVFLGYRGTASDITALAVAQEQFHALERRLMTAVSSMTDGFLLCDAEDRMLLSNERFREMFPWLADARPGAPFTELVRTSDALGAFSATDCDRRLKQHKAADATPVTYNFGNARAVRVVEQRTSDGGVVTIYSDVTEALQAEDALRAAKVEAERANQAKSEFLSAMSHELRTPMNAILGFAQLMLGSRKETLSDKQRTHIEYILKAGNHLLQLINEVLDLARIEARGLELSIEAVAICPVLDECLSLIHPNAERRGIGIDNRLQADCLPPVAVDRTRLRQVLFNLLSNAVKYNREGGTIHVEGGKTAEGRVKIAVRDTGRGIPAGRQAELFEPFNRLGVDGGDVEGTGIGLAITRQLVEAMSGSIGVESREGEGSTFWVEFLPAPPDDDAPPFPASEPATAEMAAPARCLLYIDDNPRDQALMENVLGQVDGVRLIAAPDGVLGMELAIAHRPAVIVLELDLPGMDGIETACRLRQCAETRSIPLIALSGEEPLDAARRVRGAGFALSLTKPLDVVAFLTKLEELMGGALG